jgi:hypothetical protein
VSDPPLSRGAGTQDAHSGFEESINSEFGSAASTGGRFTGSELMTDAPITKTEQKTRRIVSFRHNGIVSLCIVDNVKGIVHIDLGGNSGEENMPTRNDWRNTRGFIGGILRDQQSKKLHQFHIAKGREKERLDFPIANSSLILSLKSPIYIAYPQPDCSSNQCTLGIREFVRTKHGL